MQLNVLVSSLRRGAARCRDQADAALRQAAITVDPARRSGLLRLAAGWHDVARDLEKLSAHGFSHPIKS